MTAIFVHVTGSDHAITSESLDVGNSFFVHPVQFEGIRVRFVYEDHRVKIRVSGATKVENLYSRNVEFRPTATPVL